MMAKFINSKVVAVAICLLFAAAPAALMALTPAGTAIQATGNAQYQAVSGSQMPTATSNTVVTSVAQVASVAVSPVSGAQTAESRANFAVTVTNTGNGSDTFDLSATPQSGSAVAVYKDDNGDGTLQSTETTSAASTGALSAGSSAKYIVSVTAASATSEMVTFTAKSRFDTAKTAQAVLTAQFGKRAPYIREWLLLGYFGNTNTATRLATDYLGGESTIEPATGKATAGKTWTVHTSSADVVDLAAVYGSPIYCAGYAHIYVKSPKAQSAQLWLGSDNGIKVWVNGQNIWTNDSTRGLTPDQDKVNINLVEGWNRLLVKISQYGGNWAFIAKICDTAGVEVPGLEYSTEPSVVDTTAPAITNVAVTAGTTSATVEWDTDEPATSVVEYGATSALGQNISDESLVTHHKTVVTGLASGTTYYFKVGSADSSGNTSWDGNYTAKTGAQAAYVRKWLLCGYFANTNTATRLATDYLGGESTIEPATGKATAGKTWTVHTSSADVIDLAAVYGSPIYCAGYAHIYVKSPKAQSAQLWLGSDNGIKVWV
ncbi:MAG: fibronectin type III domain-containing protein, partial [Armatimonadota bacterium]